MQLNLSKYICPAFGKIILVEKIPDRAFSVTAVIAVE